MRLPLKIANENTQTRKKVGCVRRKKMCVFIFTWTLFVTRVCVNVYLFFGLLM